MATVETAGSSTQSADVSLDRISLATAAGVVAAGATGMLLALLPSPTPGMVLRNPVSSITTFGLVLTFTTTGLVLRRSRPDNAVGWVLLLSGGAVAVTALVWGLTYVAGLPGSDHELGRVVAWVGTIFSIPAWFLVMLHHIVRFPSGNPETPRDARLLRYGAWAVALATVVAALRPGVLLIYPAFDNPFALPGMLGSFLSALAPLALFAAVLPLALAVMGMVGRYRSAVLVTRLQLRWFAYAVSLMLISVVVFVAIGIVLAPKNDLLHDATYVLMIVAVGSLPVAVMQAIMRHRLYDIDRIIGRTFIYGALTAILAGLYSASVRLFNAVFVGVTGQEDEAALVLTTLILAATFTPIKTRLEKLVAQRFPAETPQAVPDDHPAPAGGSAKADSEDLDARMETIARRVVREALAEAGKADPAR